MLAQSNGYTADQLGLWVLILGGVLWVVKMGLDIWKDHFRTQPDPRATYATKAEVRNLHTILEAYRTTEAAASEQRRKDIHDRLESIRKEMAEDIEETRLELRGDIKDLHQRVDNIPAAIITTLKNTGALK